jgi:hypothetical protein
MDGCNSNGNSHWNIRSWEKWQKALELRKAGLTYQEIATACGIPCRNVELPPP